MELWIFKVQKSRFSSLALQEFGITIGSLKYHQGSLLTIPPKKNYNLRKAIICYAPLREFDYLIMKFDLISVIFRLHGLSTIFRNFLKNVKTLEPKTYITILSIPQVIYGRNFKGSIFPTLCRPSCGGQGESLLICKFETFAKHLTHNRLCGDTQKMCTKLSKSVRKNNHGQERSPI